MMPKSNTKSQEIESFDGDNNVYSSLPTIISNQCFCQSNLKNLNNNQNKVFPFRVVAAKPKSVKPLFRE